MSERKIVSKSFLGAGKPSVEALETLVTLSKASKVDKRYKGIYAEESKFIDSAIGLLESNAILRAKFGGGMAGAMELVGVLRDKYEERLTTQMLEPGLAHLDKYVDDDMKSASDSTLSTKRKSALVALVP